MTLSEKIQELSEIWCKCCSGYHKDRDTKHYITLEYSFGNLRFTVEHFAYIGENVNQSFNTLRAAQEFLCRELIRQIAQQIDYNLSRGDDPTDECEKPLDFWIALSKTFNLVRDVACSDSGNKVNYEELFSDIKRRYEAQNYQLEEIGKILDFHNIERAGNDFPKLEYSLNYRVELLVEKLKNK